MEVKGGFHQTDASVIPKDWDAKPIGNDIDLLAGFPFPSQGYTKFGIRLLRGSNVKRGQTDWSDENTQYWPEISSNITRFQLKVSDLVIAMDGSLVGRSFAQLQSNDLPALLLQRVARIRSIKKIDVGYLTAFIGSDRWIKYADSVKTVTAIPHISPTDIRNFIIPIPPTLKEQRAIATALSDVDVHISSLDQVIAKKHDLKQAAMQELLTGKRRLLGFEEEWENQIFEELAQPRKEKIDPKMGGEFPFCIELEDIEQGSGHLLKASHITDRSSIRSVFYKGDVLFGKLRAYLRKYWLADRNGICSTEIWPLITNNKKVTNEYLFQLIKTDPFIESASIAYGTHMPRTDWNVVKNFPVFLPKISEQRAIATVLSDMDAEIAALEQQRDKTKAIKQGMMQELLTGRIRLV